MYVNIHRCMDPDKHCTSDILVHQRKQYVSVPKQVLTLISHHYQSLIKNILAVDGVLAVYGQDIMNELSSPVSLPFWLE